LDDLFFQLRRRRLRHLVRLGVDVELHLVAGNARHVVGQLRQVELDQRQRLGLVVAEDRGVDLAAVDVLLDQRGGVELVVDVFDALHQVLDRVDQDRKSTRLNSSHVKISYAVFCLKKKRKSN